MFGSGRLMFLLRLQVSLVGVLLLSSGVFVPGQVVFFPVVLGAGAMGVGGEVMMLCSNLL